MKDASEIEAMARELVDRVCSSLPPCDLNSAMAKRELRPAITAALAAAERRGRLEGIAEAALALRNVAADYDQLEQDFDAGSVYDYGVDQCEAAISALRKEP